MLLTWCRCAGRPHVARVGTPCPSRSRRDIRRWSKIRIQLATKTSLLAVTAMKLDETQPAWHRVRMNSDGGVFWCTSPSHENASKPRIRSPGYILGMVMFQIASQRYHRQNGSDASCGIGCGSVQVQARSTSSTLRTGGHGVFREFSHSNTG